MHGQPLTLAYAIQPLTIRNDDSTILNEVNNNDELNQHVYTLKVFLLSIELLLRHYITGFRR